MSRLFDAVGCITSMITTHSCRSSHGSKPRHRRGCIATAGLNYVGVRVSLALSMKQELPSKHSSCGAGADQPHVYRRRELLNRSDWDGAPRAGYRGG